MELVEFFVTGPDR